MFKKLTRRWFMKGIEHERERVAYFMKLLNEPGEVTSKNPDECSLCAVMFFVTNGEITHEHPPVEVATK